MRAWVRAVCGALGAIMFTGIALSVVDELGWELPDALVAGLGAAIGLVVGAWFGPQLIEFARE